MNGVWTTFYLQEAKYSRFDDQYEAGYISFYDNGEPQYKLYFRVDENADGFHSENDDDRKAFYFSISPTYDGSTGTWKNIYKAVKYSSKKEPVGSFSILWEPLSDDTFNGYFYAEMIDKNGQTAIVDNASFQLILGEQHEKTVGVKRSSNSLPDQTSSSTSSSSDSSSAKKDKEYLCPRCSGSGHCPVCHGSGYLYHEFLNISRKKVCPYCAFGVCTRCSGRGWVTD